MPGFDGTGPWGAGPMTGGGRGICTGAAGYAPVYGGGRGRGFRGRGGPGSGSGRGFGRGFGWRAPYPDRGRACGPAGGGFTGMEPDAELGALREEAKVLKNDLARIEERMEALEQAPDA